MILVIDVDPAYELAGKQKYIIAIAPSDGSTAPDFFDLVTDPVAPISSSLAGAERGSVFRVNSTVGFQDSPGTEFYEKKESKTSNPNPTPTPPPPARDADIQIVSQYPPCSSTDPDCVGVVNVTLDKKLRQPKATVGVRNLKDIFGQPVTVEGSVEMTPAPPKGKDDASQYYQFSHTAARGSKPSVAINVKANSLPGFVSNFWLGRFLVQPDLAVDIGTIDFARKTDDSIRLGLTANRTFQNPHIQIVYGPGITYETNLGFKKNNLVGTFDSRFIPEGWYKTREMRRLNRAVELKKLSLDDIPASAFKFGRGLEFFLGMEAGGSLREQVFMNKAKTASIDVPRYSILRFRPRVHAFMEYDRFTLDWSGTLRLLGRTELVGEEQADKTLNMRRVRGARGLMETTLSFGIDESKHWNVAVTYKRGSQPPNFKHTNSVTTGFIVKY
ncbi:MAG TPA: hypothetical protein VM934_17105 [Pyrinomonadaceae bacterium]|nr:hypothetical protein [Pyrinomonadaceae bacterium]